MAEILQALRVGRFSPQGPILCFGFFLRTAAASFQESYWFRPVPVRAVLSASPSDALSCWFPGVSREDLLTGLPRRPRKIALWRPNLSGLPDLGVLVRNSRTQVKGKLQCGRYLLWFEPHLPETRTSIASTLVRIWRCIQSPSSNGVTSRSPGAASSMGTISLPQTLASGSGLRRPRGAACAEGSRGSASIRAPVLGLKPAMAAAVARALVYVSVM